MYLPLVKSQLSYASTVWSPYHSNNKIKLERIQRRATRWILNLKKGDTIYKERLLTLNLVPPAYDREIKDLIFFYKLVNGFYDLDILNYVSFVSHGRTRNCGIPSLVLNTPSCRTNSFQSSFFNRIVPLWNCGCKMASQSDLRSLIMFKSYLSRTYSNLLVTCFDVDITCTWSLHRSCSCHRY